MNFSYNHAYKIKKRDKLTVALHLLHITAKWKTPDNGSLTDLIRTGGVPTICLRYKKTIRLFNTF